MEHACQCVRRTPPSTVTNALATALSLGAVTTLGDDRSASIDFSLANDLVQFLAKDETLTVTYTVNVKDQDNAVSGTQTYTVTITGTNDAPLIRSNLLTDGDFEAIDLATGAPGVITDSLGNYTVGSFGAWDRHRTGGAFDPANPPISNNNTDVAWITGGSSLEQSIGSVPGNQTMQFSVVLGNRTDQAGATGFLKVIDTATNTVLASVPFDTNTILPDGTFSTAPLTVTTGVFISTSTIKVVVENTAGGQVLVDNAVLQDGPALRADRDQRRPVDHRHAERDRCRCVRHGDAKPRRGAGWCGRLGADISHCRAHGPRPQGDVHGRSDGERRTPLAATISAGPSTPARKPSTSSNNGETLTLTYTVLATDSSGGTDTETVTITITGTNDLPVIGAGDFGGVTVEDTATVADNPNTLAVETGAFLTDTGTFAFTDADLTDTHAVTAALNTITWTNPGGTLAVMPSATQTALAGALKVDVTNAATGDGAGVITWSFALDNALAQFIAKDEVVTITYDVTVTDGNAATDVETVTITITGTNDGPAISGGPVTSNIAELAESLESVSADHRRLGQLQLRRCGHHG